MVKEPGIWWKIKNKIRTRSRLKNCRKQIFGRQCISFPLTYGKEISFPTLDTVLTLSISNCL